MNSYMNYFPSIIASNFRIAGPPSNPNITYDSDSLYISAYSYMEFPVLYVDVEITDITGIPSSLSGRYNATSLLLNISSYVCLPVLVSATATNSIGTSDTEDSPPLPLNFGM